jgi:hypothetical protein
MILRERREVIGVVCNLNDIGILRWYENYIMIRLGEDSRERQRMSM